MSLWSFQGAGAGAYVRSFKTQQRGYVEVDVILGELNSRTNLYTVPDDRLAREQFHRRVQRLPA
jgi:hypothetical protein